jgi:hypothetical protein
MIAANRKEIRWDRYTAAAGIGFVVALVITIVLEKSGPDPTQSAAKVTSTFVTGRSTIIAASYFLLLDIVLFGLFAAGLKGILRPADGPNGTLSTVGFGAAMLGLGVVAVYVAIYVSLAGEVAKHTSPPVVYAFFRVSYAVDSCSDLPLALSMLAYSLIILRSSILPRWTGWVGLVGGVVYALGSLSIADPKGSPFTVFEIVGTLFLMIWMVGVSVSVLRRGGSLVSATAGVRD